MTASQASFYVVVEIEERGKPFVDQVPNLSANTLAQRVKDITDNAQVLIYIHEMNKNYLMHEEIFYNDSIHRRPREKIFSKLEIF